VILNTHTTDEFHEHDVPTAEPVAPEYESHEVQIARAKLSYFATDSQSVSQNVLASSSSVNLDQILAELIYEADVIGRLP